MQDARALRCRIRFNPEIFHEEFQRAVVREAFCIFVRNDDGKLNVPYLNCNVDRPYVNWNWLDNQWNGNYLVVRR